MNARQRGRGSKYADDFKRQLVAESWVDGVSVPMVSKRHGVPTNRIYAWRGDARFRSDGSAVDAFTLKESRILVSGAEAYVTTTAVPQTLRLAFGGAPKANLSTVLGEVRKFISI